jgi:hypothetical protein
MNLKFDKYIMNPLFQITDEIAYSQVLEDIMRVLPSTDYLPYISDDELSMRMIAVRDWLTFFIRDLITIMATEFKSYVPNGDSSKYINEGQQLQLTLMLVQKFLMSEIELTRADLEMHTETLLGFIENDYVLSILGAIYLLPNNSEILKVLLRRLADVAMELSRRNSL